MAPGRALAGRGFDLLVVVLAAWAVVEILLGTVPGSRGLVIPAALLCTLPLLLRRRFPFIAPVFVFAANIALTLLDPQAGSVDTGSIAVLLTFWAMGEGNDGQQAVAGLGLGLGTIAIIVAEDPRLGIDHAVNGALLGGLAWLLSLLLARRGRAAAAAEALAGQLERDQQERARAAVATERSRIARELHDVIAHSVSVMTVQAGAARLQLPDHPDRAVAPLLAVEETGRQALAEMRRLLGILRDDGPPALVPQPGLTDLPTLAEAVRQAGVQVAITVEGEPRELPTGVDLTAYRIVQEALTNTLKHAGPARATVIVRYHASALALEVTDDGQASSFGDTGAGHGLPGMRERVSMHGGRLLAGPGRDGGFSVSAWLPVEAAPS